MIFIVDDHELIRDGLVHGLRAAGHTIVGVASSVADARKQMLFVQAEIYIVDVQLPDGSGLELISDAGSFIVLTIGGDPKILNSAYEKGASAYVLKGEPLSHLITVIEEVGENNYRFTPQAVSADPFNLTLRELDIVRLLPRGITTHQIASLLFLSDATVKTHLAAIFRKLNVSNRTQAAIVAISHGLVIE